MSRVLDILIQAKEEIKTRGRTRGILINTETGCVCPLGAIALQVADLDTVHDGGYCLFDPSTVTYNEDATLAAETFAREAFPDEESRYFGRVWAYNDKHGRTDEEVLDVFDQAIARAREESL